MTEQKEGSKGAANKAAQPSAKEGDVKSLFENAHSDFLRALQGAPEEANQRFEEASRNYCQEVQELYTTQEGQKRLAEEGPSVGVNFYLEFLRAVQDVSRDNNKQIREAYRNYLRAVQKAWSSLDVDSADPALLAGIGQSLMMATAFAGPSTAMND